MAATSGSARAAAVRVLLTGAGIAISRDGTVTAAAAEPTAGYSFTPFEESGLAAALDVDDTLDLSDVAAMMDVRAKGGVGLATVLAGWVQDAAEGNAPQRAWASAVEATADGSGVQPGWALVPVDPHRVTLTAFQTHLVMAQVVSDLMAVHGVRRLPATPEPPTSAATAVATRGDDLPARSMNRGARSLAQAAASSPCADWLNDSVNVAADPARRHIIESVAHRVKHAGSEAERLAAEDALKTMGGAAGLEFMAGLAMLWKAFDLFINLKAEIDLDRPVLQRTKLTTEDEEGVAATLQVRYPNDESLACVRLLFAPLLDVRATGEVTGARVTWGVLPNYYRPNGTSYDDVRRAVGVCAAACRAPEASYEERLEEHGTSVVTLAGYRQDHTVGDKATPVDLNAEAYARLNLQDKEDGLAQSVTNIAAILDIAVSGPVLGVLVANLELFLRNLHYRKSLTIRDWREHLHLAYKLSIYPQTVSGEGWPLGVSGHTELSGDVTLEQDKSDPNLYVSSYGPQPLRHDLYTVSQSGSGPVVGGMNEGVYGVGDCTLRTTQRPYRVHDGTLDVPWMRVERVDDALHVDELRYEISGLNETNWLTEKVDNKCWLDVGETKKTLEQPLDTWQFSTWHAAHPWLNGDPDSQGSSADRDSDPTGGAASQTKWVPGTGDTIATADLSYVLDPVETGILGTAVMEHLEIKQQ